MITEYKHAACTVGAFYSLLRDTNCTKIQFDKVLDDIVNRTDFNKNFTSIIPCEIPKIVEDIFPFHQLILISNPDQLNTIYPVDNIKTFGFLFWLGDDSDNNQHTTRYTQKLNNGIELMDPYEGKCVKHYHPFKELFDLSTKGFYSLVLLRP